MNQIILLGRLTKDIEVNETETGKKISTMTLAVQRSYKNADGVYDTDFIECTMFDNTAQNASEYLKKGDMLGVKGRLQSRDKRLEVIAEKVTFLTKSKENQEEKLQEGREKDQEKEEDYEI